LTPIFSLDLKIFNDLAKLLDKVENKSLLCS